ncbi:hypothetical protein V2J09_009697 [Rumex salicifolius]
MSPPTKLYSVSSLLMALLFAVSASLQFNDIDWYLWIPLYASGSAVNLMSFWSTQTQSIHRLAKLPLWLGVFLFIKLSFAGDQIWSLDMRVRESREKLGTGLVLVSMILQVAASSAHNHFDIIQTYLYLGMRVIVGLALIFGAALVFMVLIAGSMVMHSASSTVQDESASWQSKLSNYVDSGTVLLIGTNYSVFFVLLFISCIIILKPPKSLVPACNKEARIQAYEWLRWLVLAMVFRIYIPGKTQILMREEERERLQDKNATAADSGYLLQISIGQYEGSINPGDSRIFATLKVEVAAASERNDNT